MRGVTGGLGSGARHWAAEAAAKRSEPNSVHASARLKTRRALLASTRNARRVIPATMKSSHASATHQRKFPRISAASLLFRVWWRATGSQAAWASAFNRSMPMRAINALPMRSRAAAPTALTSAQVRRWIVLHLSEVVEAQAVLAGPGPREAWLPRAGRLRLVAPPALAAPARKIASPCRVTETRASRRT